MTLRVAAAHIDISPNRPAILAGSGGLIPSTGIRGSLEANAIAFQSSENRYAVILTLDTLFVGPVVERSLEDHFSKVHGHDSRDLLVLASHTHYAPAIDETKPELGEVDLEYLGYVIDRCKRLLDSVLTDIGVGALIERRIGFSTASMNRRLPWPFPHLAGQRGLKIEAVMAPNPKGVVDPAITTWTIRAADGHVVACIWHFACHPTGLPVTNEVSAEYPGLARDRLRQHFGSVPVLFLQGFAGDIRPKVPETRPLWLRAARASIFGPSFDRFDRQSWQYWADSLASDVQLSFGIGVGRQSIVERGPLNEIRSSRHEIALSEIIAGLNTHRKVQFRRLRVSPIFDLVAIAAEPLMGLRELIDIPSVASVGYLGDTFGYWPTDADMRLGGYEVSGYFRPFGLTGRLRRRLDHLFRTAIEKLRDTCT